MNLFSRVRSRAIRIAWFAACVAPVSTPQAALAATPCPAIRPAFSIGYVEAFRQPIDDRDMLILIDVVGHNDGIAPRPLDLGPGAPPVLPVMGGSDPGCRQSQVGYAVARSTALATRKWGAGPARLDDLIPKLQAAFEALALRNRLDRRTVDATLRPFGMSSARLAQPSDPLAACYMAGDATNGDQNVPRFTDGVSRKAHLRVRVDLNREAHVKDIRILSNSAATAPYAPTVEFATLAVGAGAEYYTTCTNGRPKDGSFVYTADYQ